MYLLIEVAGYIQALPTIGLVMLTAVIGVFLLKRQGLATLTRGMARMQTGEMPAQEMAEGMLLAIAGALLLTPGFITDTFGFLILFPPTRLVMAAYLLRRVEVRAASGLGVGGMGAGGMGPGPDTAEGFARGEHGSRRPQPGPASQPRSGVTLEGDFERQPDGEDDRSR